MTEMTFREYHERQQLLMESDKWTAENIINSLKSANPKRGAIESLATRSDKFSKEDSDKILDLLKNIDPKDIKINKDTLEKAISRLSNNELTAEEKTDESKTQESDEVEKNQWSSVYNFYKNCISKFYLKGTIKLDAGSGSSEETRNELFDTTASEYINQALKGTPINPSNLKTNEKQKNYILLFFMFMVKAAAAKGIPDNKKEMTVSLNDCEIIFKDGQVTVNGDGTSKFSEIINNILSDNAKIGATRINFNPSALTKVDEESFDKLTLSKMKIFFDRCVNDKASLSKLLRNAPNLENAEETKEVKEIGNNKYTKNEDGTWSAEGDEKKYTDEELEKLQSQSGTGSKLEPEQEQEHNIEPATGVTGKEDEEKRENINTGSGSANDNVSKGYLFSKLSPSSNAEEVIAAFKEVFGNGLNIEDTEPFKETVKALEARQKDIVEKGKFAEAPKSLKKSLKESYSPIFKELMTNPLLEKTKNDLITLNEARIKSVDDAKARRNWTDAIDKNGPIRKLYAAHHKKANELVNKITTPGAVNKFKIPGLIVKFRDECRNYIWELADFVNKTAKKNDFGFLGTLRQDMAESKKKRMEIKNDAYAASKRGAIAIAHDEEIKKIIKNLSQEDVNKLSAEQKKVIATALAESNAMLGKTGEKSSGNQGALAAYAIIDDGNAYTFRSRIFNALNTLFSNNRMDESMVVHILRLIKSNGKEKLFGNDVYKLDEKTDLSNLKNIQNPSPILVYKKRIGTDKVDAAGKFILDKGKKFGKGALNTLEKAGTAIQDKVDNAVEGMANKSKEKANKAKEDEAETGAEAKAKGNKIIQSSRNDKLIFKSIVNTLFNAAKEEIESVEEADGKLQGKRKNVSFSVKDGKINLDEGKPITYNKTKNAEVFEDIKNFWKDQIKQKIGEYLDSKADSNGKKIYDDNQKSQIIDPIMSGDVKNLFENKLFLKSFQERSQDFDDNKIAELNKISNVNVARKEIENLLNTFGGKGKYLDEIFNKIMDFSKHDSSFIIRMMGLKERDAAVIAKIINKKTNRNYKVDSKNGFAYLQNKDDSDSKTSDSKELATSDSKELATTDKKDDVEAKKEKARKFGLSTLRNLVTNVFKKGKLNSTNSAPATNKAPTNIDVSKLDDPSLLSKIRADNSILYKLDVNKIESLINMIDSNYPQNQSLIDTLKQHVASRKDKTDMSEWNFSVYTESYFTKTRVLLEDGDEVQVRTSDAEKAVLMALSMDQGTSAQGKKWIVDNMYKGNPEAEKLVDEFIKQNTSKKAKADEILRNNQKVAPGPGGNPVQNNQQTPIQNNQQTSDQNNQQTPAVNPAAPALPQQAMANQQAQQTPATPAQNNQQAQQTPAAPAQATVTTGAADGFPNRLYKKLIRRKIGM